MTNPDTKESTFESAGFMQEDHDHAEHIMFRIHHVIQSIDEMEFGSELLEKLLQGFVEHNELHFSREDKLMKLTDCPEAVFHRQEHNRLIQELESLIDHWSKYQDTQALKTYFKDILPLWFDNHLAQFDHALKERAKETQD